jgi:uncharacterized membrane protein YuzA (DUF378 family)
MDRFFRLLVVTLCGVGAMNWGLITLFDFNLVTFLFGSFAGVSRIIYILVGVSGAVLLSHNFFGCPK